LRELSNHMKSPVILYATRWMDTPVMSQADIQLVWADKQAFMETIHGVNEKQLALILHSPGGQIEAVKAIVEYLREKFDNSYSTRCRYVRGHSLSTLIGYTNHG